MMCKFKGWTNKAGHYHVQIKRWIQNGALKYANLKGGWIRVGTMMCKLKGRWIREGIMTCKCKGGCKKGAL